MSFAVMVSPPARIAARVSTRSSSLMLPGQPCSCSLFAA